MSSHLSQGVWQLRDPAAERRIALIVTIAFLVAGSAWILFSDELLYSVVRDQAVVARLETAKGWAFVALTGLLLYTVTQRTVAQLAEAKRTISAVVESIGDGLLLLGSDRTIAYANPASIVMLRAANLRELRGMTAYEFSRRFHVSHPDGRLIPPDQFVSQRVFDEAGPIRYKAVLHPPGAPEVVISCTAAGVRTDIDTPPEIVVSVLHDITATEHLETLRDDLFTAAAHAMKTPVAVIKSAAQLVSLGGLSQVRQSMAMIDRQCARMERQVDNLLVLSRFRSGTLQLHPAEMDLGRAVEEVAREFESLSPGRHIDVRLEAHPRVRGDRPRILMVLRNTIYGAARASRPGGGLAVRLERAGDDAAVAVSYEPDVSDEDLSGGCRHTDFDDIGVGRHVTVMIVESHGGTLAEQTSHGTTTIKIRLPALPEDAS